MTLTQFFRGTCDRCGVYRDVSADSAEAARGKLQAIGWTEVCIRCSQVEAL